jgi:hypothetical protein
MYVRDVPNDINVGVLIFPGRQKWKNDWHVGIPDAKFPQPVLRKKVQGAMIHAVETEADRRSVIHRITGAIVLMVMYLGLLVGLQSYLLT